MIKKCVICNKKIEENYGKLRGTMLKIKNKKNHLIYVCYDCQKQDGWIEKAKIRGT